MKQTFGLILNIVDLLLRFPFILVFAIALVIGSTCLFIPRILVAVLTPEEYESPHWINLLEEKIDSLF